VENLSVRKIKETLVRRIYSETSDTTQDLVWTSKEIDPDDTTAVMGRGYRSYMVKLSAATPENLGEPRIMTLSIRADTAEQAKQMGLEVGSKMNFARMAVIDVTEVPQPDHELGDGTSTNATPIGDVVTPDNINPSLRDPEIPSIATADFDDFPNNLLPTEPIDPGPIPSERVAPNLGP